MYIDLEQLINLSAVPGVGQTRLRALVARFKSVEKIWDASAKELAEVDSIDLKTAGQIKKFKNFQIGKKQLERAKELGVRIISFWNDEYPPILKQIYDPPVLLFVKGKIEKIDNYAISVVGTRLASSYGKIVAEKFVRVLVQKNITIVSGMARGIDTIAHQTAIRAGGRTIAVLGSGLDKIYPPENKPLSDAISQHGAVISEFLLGTGPDAQNFPRRNRIISGMSLGTVVVEAGVKSGALLTANLALEQNREVFAVPGNINSPKSAGTNQIIKAGAKLTSSVNDILVELQAKLAPVLQKEKQTAEIPADLTAADKKILSALSHEPVHIDQLALQLRRSTAEVLSDLLPLEFRALVKQLPGKYFVRI
ncbi:MAG: DNA-protecting protein DprA [Calditrichaeota bacterium]|nr:DNA-protecting protein DprA [Calditrichota bacterium]